MINRLPDSFPYSFQYRQYFLDHPTLTIRPGICARVDLSGERLGAYTLVFPCKRDRVQYAVRCWKCIPSDMFSRIANRLSLISKFDFGAAKRYFLPFQFMKEGIKIQEINIPFILMEWIEVPDIKTYILQHHKDRNKLELLAERFSEMARCLAAAEISHNDLQPNNIRVKENGDLLLIDYDTLSLPGMLQEQDEIKGAQAFQHPLRNHNPFLSPILDRFAIIVTYASILGLIRIPSLWKVIAQAKGRDLLFGPSMPDSAKQRLIKDPVMGPLVDEIQSLSSINSLEEIPALDEGWMVKTRPGIRLCTSSLV